MLFPKQGTDKGGDAEEAVKNAAERHANDEVVVVGSKSAPVRHASGDGSWWYGRTTTE